MSLAAAHGSAVAAAAAAALDTQPTGPTIRLEQALELKPDTSGNIFSYLTLRQNLTGMPPEAPDDPAAVVAHVDSARIFRNWVCSYKKPQKRRNKAAPPEGAEEDEDFIDDEDADQGMLPPFTTPYGAFAAISGDVQVEYLEEDEEPQEEEASEGEDDSSQEGEPVTKKPKATGPVTAGGAAASGVAAAAKKKPETTAASSAAAAKKSRASSVTDASAGDSSAAVGAKPPPLVTPDPRISLQVRKIVERVTGKIDTEGLAASSGQATPVATAAAAAVAAAGVTSGASTPAATVAKAAKSAPETPAASTLPVKEGNAPRPTGGSTGKPETESPGSQQTAEPYPEHIQPLVDAIINAANSRAATSKSLRTDLDDVLKPLANVSNKLSKGQLSMVYNLLYQRGPTTISAREYREQIQRLKLERQRDEEVAKLEKLREGTVQLLTKEIAAQEDRIKAAATQAKAESGSAGPDGAASAGDDAAARPSKAKLLFIWPIALRSAMGELNAAVIAVHDLEVKIARLRYENPPPSQDERLKEFFKTAILPIFPRGWTTITSLLSVARHGSKVPRRGAGTSSSGPSAASTPTAKGDGKATPAGEKKAPTASSASASTPSAAGTLKPSGNANAPVAKTGDAGKKSGAAKPVPLATAAASPSITTATTTTQKPSSAGAQQPAPPAQNGNAAGPGKNGHSAAAPFAATSASAVPSHLPPTSSQVNWPFPGLPDARGVSMSITLDQAPLGVPMGLYPRGWGPPTFTGGAEPARTSPDKLHTYPMAHPIQGLMPSIAMQNPLGFGPISRADSPFVMAGSEPMDLVSGSGGGRGYSGGSQDMRDLTFGTRDSHIVVDEEESEST